MKNTAARLLAFALTLLTVSALGNFNSTAHGPRGRRALSGSAAHEGAAAGFVLRFNRSEIEPSADDLLMASIG